MNDKNISEMESALVDKIKQFVKTATTAEEVEALAAVVCALVRLHQC